MEIPGGSQSSRAASCLGMARGILGAVVGTTMRSQIIKHEIILVKPTEVHKKATGNNKATKEEIMTYVSNQFIDQIRMAIGKHVSTYTITVNKEIQTYHKGSFEHVADAIVIAELALERLMKE